ncbi:aromatic acid exporter family protein [Paenibacillus sp. FJAT-26967]|uniref:aromatic acid exporter family protein n=1 Tax=Paenibacillus sp. FJAT-26967 TaxID=1729690 RepID=UPI000838E09F|nr:aromatic acid exporter family protein [Paenibacillus sp. FJAT-26967]
MNIPFIGIRVLKTALAVIVSILIAGWIGLSSPNSAGLLAILGVQVTKRRGIKNAFQRIAASILAVLFASILFSLLGFSVWVLSLFVLLAFPVLHRMKLSDGAVTASVTMFHIYNAQMVSADLILNEVMLLIIGLGSATLINIAYMPKPDKMMMDHRSKVEGLFSVIFLHIAEHLRDTHAIWDGKELLELNGVLKAGTETAERSLENALLFGTEAYADMQLYFYMRSEQFESIERMVGLVSQVSQELPIGESLAGIFEELSMDCKVDYYTGRCEKKLHVLEKEFKTQPLPRTPAEFEVRAALLHLTRELHQYLITAKKQKKQKPAAARS